MDKLPDPSLAACAHGPRDRLASSGVSGDRILLIGILLNAGCLLSFKYLTALKIPVGLSFFTFIQIGYLIDASQGSAPTASILEHELFSLWFPYLLSGPIVKAEEVVPQFRHFQRGENDFSIGVSFFLIGLFKKVILASMAATIALPFFIPGSSRLHAHPLTAWMGASAYTLQVYFDFSGYSDMAIGVARLFGVRLPVNFNSPLKATSIIDFWHRWHMTLTRFLMHYIYNPLALAVARSRASSGRQSSPRHGVSFSGYLSRVVFPMMITMCIAGIWHGAGWTYAIFGLLHGMYLSAVHGWHMIKGLLAIPNWLYRLSRPFAHLLTITAVVVSLVFFGEPNYHAALTLLRSMTGFFPHTMGAGFPIATAQDIAALSLLGFIVFILPNSQEWLSRDETPLFPFPQARLSPTSIFQKWFWEPRLRIGLLWGALFFPALIAMLAAPSPSGFIYFKF